MGKKWKGTREASESTIEINFSLFKQRFYEIIVGQPTNNNLDNAEAYRQTIVQEIKSGEFEHTYKNHYDANFSNSKKNLDRIKTLYDNRRESKALTVKKWLLDYHYAHEREIEGTTAKENLRIIKKDWIPAIGHIELRDLTYKIIEKKVLEWDNVSKTIKNKLAVLRPALDKAQSEEEVTNNVLFGKKISGVQRDFNPDEHVRDPFGSSERLKLFSTITGQDFNLFLFIMWTGIRPSEVCVLKWTDILAPTESCPLGRVRINKSKPRKADKLKRTKTKSSTRKIKIFPDADYALQLQKEYTMLLDGGKGYIFHNPNTNEQWRGDEKMREHWKVWCKTAGVRYRRPYNLRHTYATLMFMSNENIRFVSKQMGHSSPTQTYDLYGDWLDEDSPETGNKAVEKFSLLDTFKSPKKEAK